MLKLHNISVKEQHVHLIINELLLIYNPVTTGLADIYSTSTTTTPAIVALAIIVQSAANFKWIYVKG